MTLECLQTNIKQYCKHKIKIKYIYFLPIILRLFYVVPVYLIKNNHSEKSVNNIQPGI